MSFLAVAVTFSIVLGTLNLVFAYGIIRRLRAESRNSSTVSLPVTDADSLGATLEEFSVRLDDGREISRESLGEGTVAAFFAPGCGPCAELLPHFVETVARSGRSVGEVLAVVVPGKEESHEYASVLGTVATVVADGDARTVEAAFGVNAYPVVCRVEADGRLTALARDLHELARPVAV
ncbi:TlpA family protein disulfide reductase [Streptomyces sp. NPDC001315]|uniref:TlpA family protein disulfide reductase n=1 Tax=Streptomyces sp. NPDC001315 TaxID=3364562 RepID=UPI003699A1F5